MSSPLAGSGRPIVRRGSPFDEAELALVEEDSRCRSAHVWQRIASVQGRPE